VKEIDGHNHSEISAALRSIPFEPGRPSCLIAHTVKGKGVDYMEDQLLWHYRTPNAEQVKQALSQLGCAP
jgi:transketolase